MQGLRYIEEVVTLELDRDRCTGCRVCTTVCPHAVFEMRDGRAAIRDLGACMECGACAKNCAWGAISVSPGVGCAEAIIRSWVFGGEPTCGCGTGAPASTACGSTASPAPTTCGAPSPGPAEEPAAPC